MTKMSKIAIATLAASALFVGCGGSGTTKKLSDELTNHVEDKVKKDFDTKKDKLENKFDKEKEKTENKLDKEKEKLKDKADKEKEKIENKVDKEKEKLKEDINKATEKDFKITDAVLAGKTFESKELGNDNEPKLKGTFNADKTATLTFMNGDKPATWSISKTEKNTIDLKVTMMGGVHDAKLVLVDGFKSGDSFKLVVPEMNLTKEYHIK
ncbi:MAG: hypothetical protein KGV58_01535 [Campylobacteraceae bacterium]|nr:hypothetical protein [Campylobacteraceae bacterium]